MIDFYEESNHIEKISERIDSSIQMDFKNDLVYSCGEIKNQYNQKTQECDEIYTNMDQLQTEIEQITDLMNQSIEESNGVAYKKRFGR